MELKQYFLKDLATLEYGKNQSKVRNPNGTIPIYGTGGLIEFGNRPLHNGPSVIIGRKGSKNIPQYIEEPFWAIDTVYYCVFNKELIHPKYFFYLISLIDLVKYDEGTSIPSYRKESLELITFDIPALDIQARIVAFIDAIDKEINLLKKSNQNLESLITALYEKTLKDSKASGRMGELAELIKVKYGKDHKKLKDGPYPVYGSGGIMRYASNFLSDQEAVLIPRKGSLNNVIYVNEPFWSVDTMFYATKAEKGSVKFAHQFLKKQDLGSLNSGSAVPSMTTKILNPMPVFIPDKEHLQQFDAESSSIYQLIQTNNREISELNLLKSALLPKLLSGEFEL